MQVIPLALKVAAVYATYASADQAQLAGKQAREDYKAAERKEVLGQRGRDIERRTSLLRSLASQVATSASAGASTAGSIGNLARQDIEQANRDRMTDDAGVAATRQSYRISGRAAVRAGNVQGASLLAEGAKNNVPGILDDIQSYGKKKK